MEEENIFILNEFHPDLIAPNKNNFQKTGGSKIVIIGKPGTGKSTLIKYLLFSKRDVIPVGIVMSGTESSNNYYSGTFPPAFVYDKYEPHIMIEIVERQKRTMNNSALKNNWLAVILDDCTYEKSVFKSEVQQYLFLNGRHLNLLYIVVSQYSVDVPPQLRSCVDGAFIFRETNERNLKILYDNYCGIFPDYKTFKFYMEKVTGNFTALYIDSQNQSTKEWHECVYYIRAPKIPTFKFGCKEYRAYGRDRVEKKWLKKGI